HLVPFQVIYEKTVNISTGDTRLFLQFNSLLLVYLPRIGLCSHEILIYLQLPWFVSSRTNNPSDKKTAETFVSAVLKCIYLMFGQLMLHVHFINVMFVRHIISHHKLFVIHLLVASETSLQTIEDGVHDRHNDQGQEE